MAPPKTTITHPSPAHAPPVLNTKLQNTLHSALLTHSSLPAIHRTLSHELSASGWTDNLRNYVLGLLRSGECTTYGQVMERVLKETGVAGPEDEDELAKDHHPKDKKDKKKANGINGVKERDKDKDKDKEDKDGDDASTAGKPTDDSIRVPERAVREGIRVVRKELERAVDVKFEDDDKS